MASSTYDAANPFFVHDIDKLCAVCNRKLEKDKYCSINEPVLKSAKHVSAVHVLESISQYRRSEEGPQNICHACFSNTSSAYKFQLMCNKSHDFIENFLDHQRLMKSKLNIEVSTEDEANSRAQLQSADETETDEAQAEHSTDKKSGARRVKCKVCHKLHRADNLKVHMRIHTGEKPYKCKVCSAAFTQWSSLKYHMDSHENKRGYVCKFCGKAFNMMSYLRVHERTHTGERPYQCDQCDLAFITNDGLKRHYVVHTKEKAFTCEYCAKSFNRKSTLRVHLKIHTNDKQHLCSLCGKDFIQLHSLKSHLESHAKRDFDGNLLKTVETLPVIKLESIAEIDYVGDVDDRCLIEEYVDDDCIAHV